MNIRARQPEDLDSVRTLLEGADLPSKGLECTEGWVAEENGRPVGHVALERTADAAVLRSLAIAPAAQGRGLARRLMDQAESEAGNRALVLRTLTIGPWAERRGYFRANPDQIPESILNTTEFEGSLCSGYPAYVRPVAGAGREIPSILGSAMVRAICQHGEVLGGIHLLDAWIVLRSGPACIILAIKTFSMGITPGESGFWSLTASATRGCGALRGGHGGIPRSESAGVPSSYPQP